MEERDLPLISVEFSLEGDEFDLCSVTNALGVLPSRTCTKEDWPDSIKNNAANLPSEIRPRTIWELDTPKVTSKSVSEQCEILMNIFKGKEGIVNKLRERYNLSAHVEVVIHMETMNGPEISLSGNVVSFLASIHADIGFDLYAY